MASGTLNPVWSYSDCGQCFQHTRGRCQIGCNSAGLLTSQFTSFLSLQRKNHTGCLTAAQNQTTVVSLRSSKSAAATVTQNTWDKLVLKNESVVLVEFYASWCGPCQMVHRVIDEVASEFKGKLDCYMVNTDVDLPLTEEYDVKAVPVVLLFKNGRKHDCIVGTMPKEFYVAAIEKLLVS